MELAHVRWSAQTVERAKLLFLHGMGGTGALWRPIAAALENDFTILAVDQRGHGKSRDADLPSFSPLDYGRDVIETMRALDFHPAWLVGHSMGVRTACATAHLKPEWVQGLVLVDLGFYGPAGGGLGDNLAIFLRRLPPSFPSREAAREFMNRECPDPSIAQYLMAVSVRATDGSITFSFDTDALVRTIDAARSFTIRDWVKEFGERKLPILVLRGAESGVWSHTEYEEEKARFAAYPSIHFEEVAGAGHGLPFEKRVEFVERVTRFVSG